MTFGQAVILLIFGAFLYFGANILLDEYRISRAKSELAVSSDTMTRAIQTDNAECARRGYPAGDPVCGY